MAEILNYKKPTFAEAMLAASKSKDVVAYLKERIAEDPRFITLFGYALNPNFTTGLPEGAPPYKPSDAPMALAEIELLHLAPKLYVLYTNEARPIRKEENLVSWLEKLNPTEAEMLIAIKDKKLHKIYKKVSEYKIVEALGWDVDMYKDLKEKAKLNGPK